MKKNEHCQGWIKRCIDDAEETWNTKIQYQLKQSGRQYLGLEIIDDGKVLTDALYALRGRFLRNGHIHGLMMKDADGCMEFMQEKRYNAS
jgi:hypothetical protein